MTREILSDLASEAKRLEAKTYHLKINGKPLHSLALELDAEKLNDPLRKLVQQNNPQAVD